MTSEQYNRVKDIFLAACDKPRPEQDAYIHESAGGDDEIRREVESLMREHRRGTQVMPSEPESPLGSMSALLSRAQFDDAQDSVEADAGEAPMPEPAGKKSAAAAGANPDPSPQITEFLDDSSFAAASKSGFIDAGRFMAGMMVASRYRVIELLGRGGMGEVYRADDVTLSQSVALKFLPALFGSDEKWLERFRNEVRLARQVTHSNVCRVFDIGEFQGEQFISMEYVDGEDLASLLRRIGRVPHDKALQIARQLCAGLAAAHDKGVLHRDLKPANVMIDGRGAVRITDFGLAAPADQLRKDAIRAGTPAYMSPEQLAGRGVTVRSDVYSLGLILYEMFTGKRAFKGGSLRDYQKMHSSEQPTPPSEIIEDIDPIVERVILKCLEKDPKNRPASAMAVSAALPGGNPLREILAAGDTPSPEVVAAAGQMQGSLRPRRALSFLLVGLLSLILVVLLAPRAFLVQRAVRHKSPAVLGDKAATFLHDQLGYPEVKDRAHGFSLNAAQYQYLQQANHNSDRWKKVVQSRSGMITYWYRERPELLVPLRADSGVEENDPPLLQPGDVRVELNAVGNLVGFAACPAGSQSDLRHSRSFVTRAAAVAASMGGAPNEAAGTTLPAGGEGGFPAWAAPLLDASGLDRSVLAPMPPLALPPVYADQRAAWATVIDGEKMHVEAAALNGRPVYFTIMGPWKNEAFTSPRAERLSVGSVNEYVQTLLNTFLLIAGGFLAWKSFRSGKADRAGALRMALAFLALGLMAWVLRAHHVTDIRQEFSLLQGAAGATLYRVAVIWIFYLALEPYVRRIWPETLVSWSRLLGGKWFDPLVSRDVLIGSAVGVLTVVLVELDLLVPRWLGSAAPLPSVSALNHILASLGSLSNLFSGAINALYVSLILLLFLVLMRMAFRRRILVSLAFIGLFILISNSRWSTSDYVSYVVQALVAVIFLTLLVRHGLVAILFCLLVRNLLTEFPVTPDLALWYGGTAMAGLGSVVFLLAVSFYAAIGGRSPITIRGLER